MTKTQDGYGTPEQTDTASASYTPNGATATLTDANGNVTTYRHDGFDRLSTTTYPGGSYEQLGYDANGSVTSRRLRDGQTITYARDALGRMTARNLPRPDTYAYDLLGRLTFANDTPGAYAAYAYDALGRKTGEQSAHGMARTMQYDAAGHRTHLIWADGLDIGYDYDATGNVTAIRENGATAGAGVLARYGYDDLGRRVSVVRGNGTTTGYGYDGASRLAVLSHDLAGTGADVSYGFAYTPAGQIASRTSSNDAYASSPPGTRNEASTVNALNQVTAVNSGPLGYDARGNLTSTGSTSYAYDVDNQLTDFPGGYIYRNPLGQWLDVNTEQRWLIYDGDATIGEVGYDGQTKRRYVEGPGSDEPIVWYEGSDTSDRRWLHADERGSVVAVSDGSGNALAINTYDEYGVPGANNLGRFQYTGQKYIPDIGLYDYKARMYSSRLGRFLQPDPIGYGDGMNWYGYVDGDPVNFVDPSGLMTIAQCNAERAAASGGDIVVCGRLSDIGKPSDLERAPAPPPSQGTGNVPQNDLCTVKTICLPPPPPPCKIPLRCGPPPPPPPPPGPCSGPVDAKGLKRGAAVGFAGGLAYNGIKLGFGAIVGAILGSAEPGGGTALGAAAGAALDAAGGAAVGTAVDYGLQKCGL